MVRDRYSSRFGTSKEIIQIDQFTSKISQYYLYMDIFKKGSLKKSGEPLKIYLADLTYDTVTLASEAMPLNVGYVASYCKKRFGEQVEITLFKYIHDLDSAIQNSPPDILGLSNLIAIKKRKGFGEKLIKYIKKYAKRKTILGFTEKHNKRFYERCGLNLNKPLLLRFIYNKKIYEGEDLVIYLDGKDNFVKTVILTKEKVILNTPFW